MYVLDSISLWVFKFSECQLRVCFSSEIKPQPNPLLLPKAVQLCIECCIFYLVLCFTVIFFTSNGVDINDPAFGQIRKWVALGAAQDSRRWDKSGRESHGGNGVRGYCDRHRAQLSHHDERAVAGWCSGPLITLLFRRPLMWGKTRNDKCVKEQAVNYCQKK